MSYEVVYLRNNSDSDNPVSVYNTSDAYGKTVLFEEAEDQSDGYFSMDVSVLLQGLHDLGFDVQGWEPKKTLHDQVSDVLNETTWTSRDDRITRLIELIQGYKP